MDRRIISIGFLTFVNVLGFAILIPVLPFIVDGFGYGPVMYGILIATYPVFQFLGAPVLGTLSDHYGRRPILIVSQTGTMLSWVLFSLSYFANPVYIGPIVLPILIIALSRLVDGITGGNFSVANAYISDIIDHKDRTKVFGILGAIVGVGLIIGPVLGGFLMSLSLGYFVVSLFSFILSLITLILMYSYLQESLPEKDRLKNFHFNIVKEVNIYAKINQFKAPNIRKLFFTRAFFALAFSSYTTTIVLFMKDIFDLTPDKVGYIFLILGSFFIINQAIVTPYLSKRFGDMRTFYIGQICMIIGLFSIVTVNSLTFFIPTLYIINLGFSLTFPTFKSIITSLVDKTNQGAVTGVDESILAGASAIAPIMASILYSYAGGYAYALFSLLILVPFITIKLRSGSFMIK